MTNYTFDEFDNYRREQKDKVRILPKQEPRVETGIIQFGDDWQGLFIRGDNCAGYVIDLQQILDKCEMHPITRIRLESLLELLQDTRESK